MRSRLALVVAALLVLARGGAAAPDDVETIEDADCGIAVTLPGTGWRSHDESAGGVPVHVYRRDAASPLPQCSLLRVPAVAFPDGLATRARQLSGLHGTAIDVIDAPLAGTPAQKIEYEVGPTRTVEFAVEREGAVLVVQVTAPKDAWVDAARAESLHAIFDSVRIVPARGPQVELDLTTRDEVRALRRRAEPARTFAIRSHDVHLRIDPQRRRLVCTDRFEVEALASEVHALDLSLSELRIDAIRSGKDDLPHTRVHPGLVRVALAKPLRAGEKLTLDFAAHADDYFFAHDQGLVAEVAVEGQVRPASSWSSHVFYYPADAENDAPVRQRITVPDGYVAVSGSTARTIAPPVSEGGWREWTYDWTDRRARRLPMGFAVAKDSQASDSSSGGTLVVDVSAPADLADRMNALADTAVQAARTFEAEIVPLPWERLAIRHVRPDRKEMGVSLPGLILLSDEHLGGAPDRGTLRGREVVAGTAGPWATVVDEVAHQWNFYAAPYPGELAEGLSTYMTLQFLESLGNRAEHEAGIRACAQLYLSAAEHSRDVALASPALFESDMYRTVAFLKVPVVLDLLRRRLGDDTFAKGWRAALSPRADPRRLDYDDFRRAFEEASGQDLRVFFDQWFLRAGHPRIRTSWEATTSDGRPAARVTVTQTQPGPAFEFPLEIDVRTSAGRVTKTANVASREESFVWELASAPLGVDADPRGRMFLLRQLAR